MYESDPWVLLVLVVGYAGYLGVEKVREWRAPTEREELRQQYVTGEIDLSEYERRLETRMDPRNDRIREAVERVNGVGPVTAREIALAFESVGELRRADRGDLLDVPGVGPERADAILDRLR